MNKKEKRKLAVKMLKKHGYTDEEIRKILKFAFDKEKKESDTKE